MADAAAAVGSAAAEKLLLARVAAQMKAFPGYAQVRAELHDMMRARPGAIVEPLAEPIGMA